MFGVLTFLSLTLINPFGAFRGDIWTEPKKWALILWATATWIYLLPLLLRAHSRVRPLFPFLLGFSAFLAAGAYAALRSPFPFRAWFGQSTMGDGLAYWVTVGALALGTALLLYFRPGLFRSQLYGVLAAGALQALSVLPQALWDWRLDYTTTLGQTYPGGDPLLSTIWSGQMPIGLTSHRGHVAAILALVGVLAAAVYLRRKQKLALVLLALLTFALWLTYTRGAYLALFGGLIALYPWHRDKRAWIGILSTLLASYGTFLLVRSLDLTTVDRSMPSLHLEDPDTFSSGRLRLWNLSLQAIARNPWGYGFDGFGLAFPFVADFSGKERRYLQADAPPPAKVVEIEDYGFRYRDPEGEEHWGALASNKAHNLLLDLLLSVGPLGTVGYLAAFLTLLWLAARGSEPGLTALGVAYLVYGLTWFECAQFSHLPWWALAAGAGLFLRKSAEASGGAEPPLRAQGGPPHPGRPDPLLTGGSPEGGPPDP
ncbi:MAG: O-antigen ligase family protein [Thermus sp.]|uniref:O-antigen ligase family protein n=1 Tax=Thermus sp. TaxID=275 RepID=UPI003D0A8A26